MRSRRRELVIRVLCCLAAAGVGCIQQVQGIVNTTLAARFSSDGDGSCFVAPQLLAAFLSFCGGTIALLLLNVVIHAAAVARGTSTALGRPRRLWECTGGLLGGSVMTLALIALPHTGLALLYVLASSGTNISAIVMDHLGCLGSTVRPVTRRRASGTLLLLSGMALAAGAAIGRETSEHVYLYAPLPMLAGVLLTLQSAVNASLARQLGGTPVRASLVSFVGGSCYLGASVLVCGSPPNGGAALRGVPAWELTGGLLGLVGVTSNLFLPRYLGLAANFAACLGGGLLSSLVFDGLGVGLLAARPPDAPRLCGALLVFAGAALSQPPPKRSTLLGRDSAREGSSSSSHCDPDEGRGGRTSSTSVVEMVRAGAWTDASVRTANAEGGKAKGASPEA